MLESRNRPAWMTHAPFDEQRIPSLEHLVLCAWNFAIYTCREENKQPYVRHGKIKYATINNSYGNILTVEIVGASLRDEGVFFFAKVSSPVLAYKKMVYTVRDYLCDHEKMLQLYTLRLGSYQGKEKIFILWNIYTDGRRMISSSAFRAACSQKIYKIVILFRCTSVNTISPDRFLFYFILFF